jgi:hypothetical protein
MRRARSQIVRVVGESVGVSSVVVSSRCEKLVAEARGQFGNPEEGERPPLEAVTRKLATTRQAEKT